MKKAIQFGEHVEGYSIPVLNEREIRAAAGILFLATFIALMLIMFKNNFLPVKYVITFFMVDLLIRVFINPRFSPTLIIGRLIVRNQVPEYVAAAPKKFAWKNIRDPASHCACIHRSHFRYGLVIQRSAQ